MTFTGFIGTVCMFPMRAIIAASVALRIHPNTLTLIGLLINIAAAVALGLNHFMMAGVIMIVANIFDFIDGKVAQETNTVSRFGAFWDSTLDRFSDIALFLGLIYLYATLRRTSEFGLRMALGADARRVRRMVLSEAMRLVIGGTIVGVPLAIATTRLLRNQLFGVELVDVPSIVVALVVLAASAAIAGYVPASRAARVGPLEALRSD